MPFVLLHPGFFGHSVSLHGVVLQSRKMVLLELLLIRICRLAVSDSTLGSLRWHLLSITQWLKQQLMRWKAFVMCNLTLLIDPICGHGHGDFYFKLDSINIGIRCIHVTDWNMFCSFQCTTRRHSFSSFIANAKRQLIFSLCREGFNISLCYSKPSSLKSSFFIHRKRCILFGRKVTTEGSHSPGWYANSCVKDKEIPDRIPSAAVHEQVHRSYNLFIFFCKWSKGAPEI